MAWVRAVPIEVFGEGEHRGTGDSDRAKSETPLKLAWLGAALVARRGDGRGDFGRLLVNFHCAAVDFQGGGRTWTALAFHSRQDFLHSDGAAPFRRGFFNRLPYSLNHVPPF